VLILREIVAGCIPQQDADLLEDILGTGGRGTGPADFVAEGMGRTGDEPECLSIFFPVGSPDTVQLFFKM
jgi:hypothetical protein